MAEDLRVLLHNNETALLARRLVARFPDIGVQECTTYEDLPAMVERFRPDVVYTVRFAGTPGFPRAALFSKNGPRWVSNGGAGTDHFGHWDTNRTTVTNAAGVAADMMAEYVMGGFLHFTLDVPGLQTDQRTRVWNARTLRPLKGQTLLIVGLGHTGRAIAARAKAFGLHVIGTRAAPRPMADVDEVFAAADLLACLGRADFIAVSTPLTPQTTGLLGPDAFRAVKPGAILADVSRGSVIDQTALHDALVAGTVAAAVLDVFEKEPLPPESPLWQLEHVLLSPHCSSVYDGWEMASFDLFLDNLQRWRAGRALENIVDPHRGY